MPTRIYIDTNTHTVAIFAHLSSSFFSNVMYMFVSRDGRFGIPRSAPLSAEEHQRMQYNQMLSGRNVQQPNLPVPGAVSASERSVRILPGGSAMGMMSGVNRNMAIPRPGYQGISPSSMLNSGNMLSSGLVGAPSPVNIHSGVASGQGNTMMRSREALHMMRVRMMSVRIVLVDVHVHVLMLLRSHCLGIPQRKS